jgi:thiosulfate dehydrogenase [quinone] large subunit
MRRVGTAFGLVALGGAIEPALAPLRVAAAGTARGAAKQAGLWLGNVKNLARNAAVSYTDPKTGDPAVLVHLTDGRYVAYDVVCTHAGCTVPYDPARKLFVCPCHGAKYDPAQGARVVGGPAPAPLAKLPVRVDAQGNVYALNAKPSANRVNRLKNAPPPSRGNDDDGNGNEGGDSSSKKPSSSGDN